jgi:hypothetical protein
MDFKPPSIPPLPAPEVREEKPHDGPEPVLPRVVPIVQPVRGYLYDSAGNVQGGAIMTEDFHIKYE